MHIASFSMAIPDRLSWFLCRLAPFCVEVPLYINQSINQSINLDLKILHWNA